MSHPSVIAQKTTEIWYESVDISRCYFQICVDIFYLLWETWGHIRGGRDGDGHCDLEDYGKSGKGVGLQGRNVVKDLTRKLRGRGHILTTNNFFTFVPLFLDLLDLGIMATGTLHSDRKYLPREIWAKKITKTKAMGWCDWRMHSSKKNMLHGLERQETGASPFNTCGAHSPSRSKIACS